MTAYKSFKNYLPLAIAIILTGAISASMHGLILQYFQAPEIKSAVCLSTFCGFTIRFCTVLGSMFIYILSKTWWQQITLPYRIILFTTLMLALNEMLFRGLIMDFIVSNALLYQVLVTIPPYFGYLSFSIIICVFIPIVSRLKMFRIINYLLLALTGTVISILVRNGLQNLLSNLLMHVPQPQQLLISQLPYGLNVLLPAYITFLEPTIAAFITFYLIKDQLSAYSTAIKGLILGGIIVVTHAGIYSLLQIIYSEGSIAYRIFYYGQFLWEYLALGMLTAYSIKMCSIKYKIVAQG